MPEFGTISHLDLSVVDAEKSADWYCSVLGVDRLRRADLDNRIMIVLRHPITGLIIGVNQHAHTATDRFDEHVVGLDHVGFSVAQRGDLDAWEKHLVELNVEHSPVADTANGAALVFRDPDNIQLEFWWSK